MSGFFAYNPVTGQIQLMEITPFGVIAVWTWDNWDQVDFFKDRLDELKKTATEKGNQGIPESIIKDLGG